VTFKPLKTEADYDAAMARIDELWGSAADTLAGDELHVLFALAGMYEDKHFHTPPPKPLDVIEYWLDCGRVSWDDILAVKARLS